MDKPRLLDIQTAPDKGEPMESHQSITALEGKGLWGDRYATGKGAWSKSKREVERHATLIESEVLEAVRAEEGLDVTFAETRRNLLTAGIRLNDFVGKRLVINGVIFEGVELCDPCGRPGNLSGKPDLKQRFEAVMQNRGGLRVKILSTGVLTVGDEIEIN